MNPWSLVLGEMIFSKGLEYASSCVNVAIFTIILDSKKKPCYID